MKIKWFGHSAFLITSDDGFRIIIDPYRYGAFDLGYKRISEEAHIVVISHDHEDHNGVGELPGSPKVVSGEGPETINGIEFKGIITSHEDEKHTPNTVWRFPVDGIKLCHLGDLGCALTSEQVMDIGGVDILMIPVGNGEPTLSIEDTHRVVEQIKPCIVIPMHYNVPGKCDWDIQPIGSFLVNSQNVRRLSGSEVTFRKDHLPELTEIVVLEPAN